MPEQAVVGILQASQPAHPDESEKWYMDVPFTDLRMESS